MVCLYLGCVTNIFHAVGPANPIHVYLIALIIFSENICECILPLHVFFFYPMAQQPLVGQGLLIIEALLSHSVKLFMLHVVK
jgi:hypothetical protein